MSRLKIIFIPLIIIVVLWSLSGIYIVNSGEEAVLTRFGKYTDTVTAAGPKWYWPSPIGNVKTVNVAEVHRLEFGFRTIREAGRASMADYKVVPEEASMLTSDENLVNLEIIFQYRIFDTKNYLFHVDDQIGTLRLAAYSAVRRVAASYRLDDALTENKSAIQNAIREWAQATLDLYNIGVSITAVQLQDVTPPIEVSAAFNDVVKAREDKNTAINHAQAYANQIIPGARGNAAQLINQAEAFKAKRIAEAQGDVAMFEQIYKEYQTGKTVTRTRLYLETLEEILPDIEKYIVDSSGNTLQFLPLSKEGGLPR